MRNSSFTDFSKSFPDSHGRRRKSYAERQKQRKTLLISLAVCGVLLLFLACFFVTNMLLELSEAPPTDSAANPSTAAPPLGTSAAPPTQTTAPPAASSGFRAGYAGPSVLGGGQPLTRFLNQAKEKGWNAVLIDFKDRSGTINYPSALPVAEKTGSAAKAYPASADSVRALQEKGLLVIARIYCFQDPPAAREMRAAAVQYRQEGKLWLDQAAEQGGQPWLNPYAADAVKYLCGVVTEVSALGADYILLEAVQFARGSLTSAYFTGEKAPGALSRNAVLGDFVSQAKQAAGPVPVLCSMAAGAAFGTPSLQYDGDLWNCGADGFVIPMELSQLPQLGNIPAGKHAIPLLPQAPKSGEYMLSK